MATVKKRDRVLLRRGSDCQSKISELASLDDVYSDISHLGTGRFSDVALVTHRESQQRVALKMFQKDTCKYVDFIREYNYSFFLAPHTNMVVTYEGLYSTKQSYFFVQEFCPTGSLREAVYECGVIREDLAKVILKQMMAAIEFMHGEGLVHRNLRAKNVLIFDRVNYEKVKITDFALTRKTEKQVKHIDHPNEYHAPELVEILVKEHTQVNPAVDVWAVGVILYFMLIGKYPWQRAAPDVKPYFEWEQWQKKKSTVMPPKWGRFTEKGLKVFRKALKIRADDRCSAKEIRKWINTDKWLKVDMTKTMSMDNFRGMQSSNVSLLPSPRPPLTKKNSTASTVGRPRPPSNVNAVDRKTSLAVARKTTPRHARLSQPMVGLQTTLHVPSAHNAARHSFDQSAFTAPSKGSKRSALRSFIQSTVNAMSEISEQVVSAQQ